MNKPFRALFLSLIILISIIAKASAQADPPAADDVTTVITIEGLDFRLKDYMPQALHSFAMQPGRVRKRLQFPASASARSIRVGVKALDEAIRTIPGKKIILAHSQGAQVSGEWMREHAYADDAPPADELSFILFGNPERLLGRRPGGKGFDGKPLLPTPNDTKYTVIDICRRYDGWCNADNWPDTDDENSTRLARGRFFDHPHYEDVDIDDPDNQIRDTIGNTTYIVTAK